MTGEREPAGIAWLADLPELRLVRSHAFGPSGRRLALRLGNASALTAAVPAHERPVLLEACRRAAAGARASCVHGVRLGREQLRCRTTIRLHRGRTGAPALVGITRVLGQGAKSTPRAAERMPGLALLLDRDLCVRQAEGALELPGEGALTGKRLDELLPTADLEAVHARLAAGESASWDTARDGRIFSVRVSPAPAGSDEGLAALVVDATARKRAEEELRASAERLRTIVTTNPDAIFLKDGEGRWLEANQVALEMFHLGQIDFQGKTDAELSTLTDFYRDALQFCIRTDEEAWDAGRRVRCEERVPQPDGSVRTYDVIKVPLFNRDGSRKSFVVLGRDITDRRRLEAERDRLLELESLARESAERARHRSEFLATASRSLAQSLDFESTVAAAARLALPSLADHATIDLREAATLVRVAEAGEADTGPALEEPALVQVARTGVAQFWAHDGDRWRACEQETCLEGKRWRRRAVSVAMDARGRTMGVFTFCSASSQLPAGAEDVLLAEELARRAALAIDNARLYRDATEAIRSREEFLAVASHELRTPLTTMQLGVQRLLQYARAGTLAELPPERVLRLLESADRQRVRLGMLVNRLLVGARIGEGQLELPLDDVDLYAVVRDVLDSFAEEASRSGSTIDLKGGAVVGRWEPFRLEQIATSLISNAIKYGEGKPITVEVTEREGIASLRVTDRGIGIPAERLPEIFERFERAASWRHYSGLGLGLYVARKLAAELGGTIEASSEPGKGSTFEARLPIEGPSRSAR